MFWLLLILSILLAFNMGLMIGIGYLILQYRKEILVMGNEQEQALNEAITGLKAAITAASQRVIDKLAELSTNNPDLTDEIAEVSALAEAVNAIAAGTAEEPPVDEPPVDEPPVDEPPAEGDGSGEKEPDGSGGGGSIL